jgi:hypothetical protein
MPATRHSVPRSSLSLTRSMILETNIVETEAMPVALPN